jgi:hypothetical protein
MAVRRCSLCGRELRADEGLPGALTCPDCAAAPPAGWPGTEDSGEPASEFGALETTEAHARGLRVEVAVKAAADYLLIPALLDCLLVTWFLWRFAIPSMGIMFTLFAIFLVVYYLPAVLVMVGAARLRNRRGYAGAFVTVGLTVQVSIVLVVHVGLMSLVLLGVWSSPQALLRVGTAVGLSIEVVLWSGMATVFAVFGLVGAHKALGLLRKPEVRSAFR